MPFKSLPKSPKLLQIFNLCEYFPWWHDDDDFTIHLMKNRSNDSDWSESSPISNKLQTMKLLSHICNCCLMTQWYIDSHVLVPSSADSLALLSVISVCWTVIQHSPDQGGPHSYQTWQLGSKIYCTALLNVFSCHSIIHQFTPITNFETIISMKLTCSDKLKVRICHFFTIFKHFKWSYNVQVARAHVIHTSNNHQK